jgi:hypothetical protein
MTLHFTSSPFARNDNAIEVSPDLPMTAYHALEGWHPERIGALALYCSDGRWGDAFDEFCHRHLHIPRYDRWAIPGGPACLAASAKDETLLRGARIQLDFLVQAHNLERAVLITHYACAWYGHLRESLPAECLNSQIDDVKSAAGTLRTWYPSLRVDAYLAMRQNARLSFHQLDVAER